MRAPILIHAKCSKPSEAPNIIHANINTYMYTVCHTKTPVSLRKTMTLFMVLSL